MKTPSKTLLLLLVICGAFGTVVTEAVWAQSCYRSAGNPGHNRFEAGPVWACNTSDGFGSPIIGAFYNDTFGSNAQVRKAYKAEERGAKRAYDDGVRCVNKLLQSGNINSAQAEEHSYHLKTEYEDLRAAWEDWYEEYYGALCQ